jgi:hypothetical protein
MWLISRLDAASLVLLEKLDKLEATMLDQAAVLARIQDATSDLQNSQVKPNHVLEHPQFLPSPQRSTPVMFQVPKGGWASMDHFMSLPFVKELMPTGRTYKQLVCDDTNVHSETRLPNLDKTHIRKLSQRFLDNLLPLYPVIDITTVQKMIKDLEEEGLSWTGETAVIMHILAIGCILIGEDPLEYNCAAKRRMGFAIEQVNILAIQAHYLLGYDLLISNSLSQIILAFVMSTDPCGEIISSCLDECLPIFHVPTLAFHLTEVPYRRTESSRISKSVCSGSV